MDRTPVEILKPGSELGAYEVLGELGRGALGTVYSARHLHLDRPVALKVLHACWTVSPEFVQRFREEGRLMARLESRSPWGSAGGSIPSGTAPPSAA